MKLASTSSDRQTKENLLSFVELAVDAIFSVDQQGMIAGVNTKACEITGYASEELQGMSFLKLITADGNESSSLLKELLKEGKPVEFECKITRKAGLPVPVDMHVKQMPDGTYQCFMRDITERKKMEENLLARQRKINAMAIDLSIAEERERCRIAGELHDQVGPTLLLVKMKLEALKSEIQSGEYKSYFDSIEELMDRSVQDIISLTFQLRPPILANAGLEAALKWLAQEFGQKYGLQVKVLDDMSSKPLKYEVRSVLFQTVRELLLNVSKHAGTKNAVISMKKELDEIVVMIEDDGIGFLVEKNADGTVKTSGFGIFNIQNKIEFLGGRVTIDSSPGSGTHVTILAPLETGNI